jgi:hypothetical protein
MSPQDPAGVRGGGFGAQRPWLFKVQYRVCRLTPNSPLSVDYFWSNHKLASTPVWVALKSRQTLLVSTDRNGGRDSGP